MQQNEDTVKFRKEGFQNLAVSVFFLYFCYSINKLF